MGYGVTDWAAVEGALYMGAGGAESFWFFVAAGCCVLALVMGLVHEKLAYRKHK